MRLRRLAPALLALAFVSLMPALAYAGEDNQFTRALKDNGPMFAALAAFAGGLLVCLTPCVYPMIAITVSVFGARESKSRAKAALLSTCFLAGIVAMFAPLGVIAGLTGGTTDFMQKPAVHLCVGLLFLAMAASMFGAFEMVLPESIMQRLSGVGGMGYGGAFLLGLVSGIIAAPCTGPVLTGILSAITLEATESGPRGAALGALWMSFFSIGLGLPFWLVGTFAISLPKSGKWMVWVKSFFGVVLAVAALYYVQLAFHVTTKTFVEELAGIFRMTPGSIGFVLLAGGFLAVGIALGGIHLEFSDERARKRLRKGIGVLLMVSGGAVGVAGLKYEKPHTEGIAFMHDEAAALKLARDEQRPLLIDFFAEWCGACKDLSRDTFANPEVGERASHFVALKLDLTVDATLPEDEQDRREEQFEELKKKYGVRGLPTVILFDSAQKEVERFVDFLPPDEFLKKIEKIN